MATTEEIAAETRAERSRLVAALDTLGADQWAHPSLCAGWQVREVVAHITMPFRSTLPGFVLGLARARFSFDRYADRDARATTASRSDDELLELVRANIDHPWSPPGGGEVGALSHDVIHGLDITEALGLPRPPVDRVGLVLKNAGDQNLRHFGTDLTDTRLVATDADVSVGAENGTVIRLPVVDLLLVVTGRRPVPRPVGDQS